VAERSLQLQRLSVPNLIDAVDFFTASPFIRWKELVWLSLTSKALKSQNKADMLEDLLVAAGSAAMRMPKLKMMEIWNGGPRYACIFRYKRGQKEQDGSWVPRIIWKQIWEPQWVLGPRVIERWKDVAGAAAWHDGVQN
jgi:hypothetical protein